MKIIDRLLILTLAVGVWALVLKPSPLEAHGGVSHEWFTNTFHPWVREMNREINQLLEDVEKLKRSEAEDDLRRHKMYDH